MQSHCHVVRKQGSGVSSWKPQTLREASVASTLTERLDAELLMDLRGLCKPPSFDGNDTDYHDFHFSFRIYMNLVNDVSNTLMDKCEAERNPITLAGKQHSVKHILKRMDVLLVGFDHERKCPNPCRIRERIQRKSKRLIHSKYAPHTQIIVMQKIMMLVKPWCDHAESFQSSIRAWTLDVGEWERTSRPFQATQ